MKHLSLLLTISACWLQPALAQINWTPYEGNPVIGREFDIESQTIYRPSVVKWQGAYHMWYGKLWQETRWIAYTRSDDGIMWDNSSRDGFDNAVLGPSPNEGAFDEFEATHGWIIVDGDTLKMWYSGGGSQGSSIGFAWSTDRISWTRVQGSRSGGSVLDADADGSGALAITHPAVVKIDGLYHMWYVRAAANSTSNIGYARSADGRSWEVIAGNGASGAVIDRGEGTEFDSIALLFPSVLHNGERFEMWYQGVGFDPFVQLIPRVGCARSDDGITWEKIAGAQAAAGACFNSLAQPFVLLEDGLYKMWYALSAVDPNDDVVQYATSGETGSHVEEVEVPSLSKAISAYPNPTTTQVTVRFEVDRHAAFVMQVHDVLGRMISLIDLGLRAPGSQIAVWETSDANGVDVPSGTYILAIANPSTGERSVGGIVHVLR